MKRIIYVSLFLLFSLVVLINTVNISYSINTYEIKTEGEYYLNGGTNVSLSGSYCKKFTNMNDGTTAVYRDNNELIKIPNKVSNYMLIIKNNGKTNGNLKEATCSLYEYNAPLFNITCTANSIGADESAFCDLYLTTSNYGVENIRFTKNSENLSITDFDSVNFNIIESNNKYTFMPKTELEINKKYLVGTIKVTNISIGDGIDNTLIFDDIVIKDTVSSFKIESIKRTFMEGKIDYENSEITTTAVSREATPKTDIEYKSNVQNRSSKAKVRNIILLFLFVIIFSITLGFVVVFLLRDKKN